VGDLGPSAYSFLNFLALSGIHFWQVLPVNPTAPALGNSPYSAYSAFAGYELLISPELMVRDGWVDEAQAEGAKQNPEELVDFETTIKLKSALIDLAFARAAKTLLDREDFGQFLGDNGFWLNDYAFFMAAKEEFGRGAWSDWPEGLKRRDEAELRHLGEALFRSILRIKFGQFLFFKQLGLLKAEAKRLSIGLIGDTAFYVNYDSSDVWANPKLFDLDERKRTNRMAGVPPDYFAQTGQLWGNPIFNWSENRAEGYAWWKSRILHNLGLFDWVRLDHFRAFSAFWAVEPGSETARHGSWQPGPGEEIFKACGSNRLNIVAEDLGLITPDVTNLRRAFGFPGMRVLQFGFGEDGALSTHAPFRIEVDNLVYSSTHDNNTARGWFELECDEKAIKRLSEVAGYKVTAENAAWTLIRLVYLCPGALCLTTVQDLLNQGPGYRLNTPGQARGNWGYRLLSFDLLNNQLSEKLANLGVLSGRDNLSHPNILTYLSVY
jgi:4-alpha-glucanotransferase